MRTCTVPNKSWMHVGDIKTLCKEQAEESREHAGVQAKKQHKRQNIACDMK